MKKTILLYAVTDRRWLKEGQTLASVVEDILKNGVTLVQLREKELDDAAFEAEALEIMNVCHKYKVPLIINDNVELAVKIGADGVHVGQSDIKGRDIRAMIGPDMILGITAKTVEQIRTAEASGADYIGTGAVFGTSTKKDALAMPIETFRSLADCSDLPFTAIGGITRENVELLADSHTDGIAVVSGIFAAEDPGAAAAELRKTAEKLFL